MGAPIIMGRKTYESIGKPLQGRTSIVITKNLNYKADGCIVVNSLESAIDAANEYNEAFIIGGEQIYREAMKAADKIYLTRVYESFEGDSFFHEIDTKIWKETERKDYEADEKNKYKYSFFTYVRKV